MREVVRINLDEVGRSETGPCLSMTVTKGVEIEQLMEAVSEETAVALENILREEPFSPTKPGTYQYELQEISEGPGFPKTLTIQISKGRSRTKRNVVIDRELFLTLRNIVHFQELPSEMLSQKRLR